MEKRLQSVQPSVKRLSTALNNIGYGNSDVNMLITVTSDTHLKRYGDLPPSLKSDLEGADVVFHAGDLVSEDFYEELEARVKKLYAVRGNNDFYDIPLELIVRLEEIGIAIIHSDGFFFDRQDKLVKHFERAAPHLIIFGHTHKPFLSRAEKTYTGGSFEAMGRYSPVLLNPGSPTRSRGEPHSYVLLKASGKKFEIEFRYLS